MKRYCRRMPAVGDRGQRFEVSFFDPDTDARRVLGWSETREGASAFERAIESHPSWCAPQVRDRGAGGNG